MMKKTSSRNQRSKGIKVKHVLQICVLLGVCVWLIYQLKYSHDKKKEFDEKDTKTSIRSQSEDEVLKLGRKDLPGLTGDFKNRKRSKDEETDMTGEEESSHEEEELKEVEMRHEEDEQEEANDNHEEEQEEANDHLEEEQADEETKNMEDEGENKNEEVENDAEEGGDDEIDEQDQDKKGEIEREDEFLEEDKELEVDAGENESETNKMEEEKGRVKNETVSESKQRDRGDTNSREEHYKADDASSAVSHDVQVDNTVAENKGLEFTSEDRRAFILRQENNVLNNTGESGGETVASALKLVDAKGKDSLGTTNSEEEQQKNKTLNSVSILLPDASKNTTVAETDTSNNFTRSSLEISGLKQNGTEITSAANQVPNITVADATKLEQAVEMKKSNLSSLDLEKTEAGQSSNLTHSSGLVTPENITMPGSAYQEKENPEPSTPYANSTPDKESDGGSSGLSLMNSATDMVENDPIDDSDTTISRGEREAHADLDALPDVRTEGGNTDEIAAE